MDKQAKDFEKGWEEYKAKKKQEIEEIYRLIDNSCALVNNCIECQFGKQDKFDCDKLCAATAIINAGYRKIPESAVVLTREEYQMLNYFNHRGEELLKQERKETAEKFVSLLEERCKEKAGFEYSFGNIRNIIDEITKEFTEAKSERND